MEDTVHNARLYVVVEGTVTRECLPAFFYWTNSLGPLIPRKKYFECCLDSEEFFEILIAFKNDHFLEWL